MTCPQENIDAGRSDEQLGGLDFLCTNGPGGFTLFYGKAAREAHKLLVVLQNDQREHSCSPEQRTFVSVKVKGNAVATARIYNKRCGLEIRYRCIRLAVLCPPALVDRNIKIRGRYCQAVNTHKGGAADFCLKRCPGAKISRRSGRWRFLFHHRQAKIHIPQREPKGSVVRRIIVVYDTVLIAVYIIGAVYTSKGIHMGGAYCEETHLYVVLRRRAICDSDLDSALFKGKVPAYEEETKNVKIYMALRLKQGTP